MQYTNLGKTGLKVSRLCLGMMTVHDMVEHMSDSFRQANGKDIHTEILTPLENIAKLQAFVLSDKPMRKKNYSKIR